MLPATLYAILSSTYGPYVPPPVVTTVINFNSLESSITNSSGKALTGTEFESQGVRFVGNSGNLTLIAFSSTKGNNVGLAPSPDGSVFVVGLNYSVQFLTGFDFTKLQLDLVGQSSNSIQGTLFGTTGSVNISYPAPGGAWAWKDDEVLVNGTIGRLNTLTFGSNAFVGMDNLTLS
jgi:hypothetical protein